MGYLSERIEASVSETVAQWYETELNAAFSIMSATIHMAAETAMGCSAIVIQNIEGTGLDIVITQECEAPHLVRGGVQVSLYSNFLGADRRADAGIWEMTGKTYNEHENALEYVLELRDIAKAISKLNLRHSMQTDFIKVHIPKNDSVFNHPENQTAVIGIDCPPYGHNRILEIFLDESEADAFINNGGKNA